MTMTGMVPGKLAALSQNHRPFLLLLSVYIAITGILIAYFAPFSGPNEVLHYEYVALMRQTGQLPDLATSFRADERHQPPVYYTVATLTSLPFPTPPLDDIFTPNPHFVSTHRGNLNPYIHLPAEAVVVATAARVASLLFGVLALVALYVAANYTLPRGVSLLIVSLTAFQPTFLQLSSTINNDLAVTAVSTILVAYTVHLIVRQKSGVPFLFWGVLLALAVLTKASAIFLTLLLPLACLSVWQQQKRFWPALQSGLWGIAGFVPLYGAWLLFNHVRSGDALGLAPSVPIRALFTLRPADFPQIIPFVPELFRSFWLDWSPGIVGYGPDWFYGVMAFLLLIGLAGWLKRSENLAQPWLLTLAHLLWFGGLAAAFLAVKTLMVLHSGYVVPEGRWLLPAWPSLAWLVGVGWARWWPAARQPIACGVKTAVYPLTATLLLIFLMPQLYPQATRLAAPGQIPAEATYAHLIYDDHIELVAVETAELTIDQPTPLTLYWHSHQQPAKEYTFSTQLLRWQEAEWAKLDDQSSFPGSGRSPTLGWQAGGIYRDQIVLRPAGRLDGPTQAVLAVWLTNSDSARIQREGQPVDWPVAASLVVRPKDPIPLPENQLETAVSFDSQFTLQALTYEISQDEGLVTLYWQAEQEVSDSYTIFIHLIDETGRLVAQSDKIPANGSSPTHVWRRGDLVRDEHRLGPFPPDGTLLIGAYDPVTGQRLPVIYQGVPQPDNVWRYALENGR
jgi:hypothetical protein